MKTTAVLLVSALLVFAGCGGDDESNGSKPAEQSEAAKKDGAAQKPEKPTAKKDEASPSAGTGTEIILDDSEFGTMLYGSDKQAIYIFENDSKGKSNCNGDCAAAWPPVFTKGEPKAGKGVKQELLGMTKRRDGKLQVTYADQPLYYYANEEPGEVRCHNVDLNGGLWWVVGPDGKHRQ